MSYVTKDDVDKALILWHQAADRASLAHIAWGHLLKGQHCIAQSMISQGVLPADARREVDNTVAAHKEAVLVAMQDMNDRGRHYRTLQAEYLHNNLPRKP